METVLLLHRVPEEALEGRAQAQAQVRQGGEAEREQRRRRAPPRRADAVAAARALIQYMARITSRTPVPPERFFFDADGLAQRTQERCFFTL